MQDTCNAAQKRSILHIIHSEPHLISTEPIQNAADRRRVKEGQRRAHQIAKRAVVHEERGSLTDKGQTQSGDQREYDLPDAERAIHDEVKRDGLRVKVARPRGEPPIRNDLDTLCKREHGCTCKECRQVSMSKVKPALSRFRLQRTRGGYAGGNQDGQ